MTMTQETKLKLLDLLSHNRKISETLQSINEGYVDIIMIQRMLKIVTDTQIKIIEQLID